MLIGLSRTACPPKARQRRVLGLAPVRRIGSRFDPILVSNLAREIKEKTERSCSAPSVASCEKVWNDSRHAAGFASRDQARARVALIEAREQTFGALRASSFRSLVFLLLAFGLAGSALAQAPATGRYDQVVVPPAKTSIYLGSVTMIMRAFVRQGGAYESSYQAKVFPYFFSNEQGRLTVEISDEQLDRLARGERIEFKGRGVRDDGVERRIEGTATPIDATSGKLKVRVFVSKRIELIFNTTYRFGEDLGHK